MHAFLATLDWMGWDRVLGFPEMMDCNLELKAGQTLSSLLIALVRVFQKRNWTMNAKREVLSIQRRESKTKKLTMVASDHGNKVK